MVVALSDPETPRSFGVRSEGGESRRCRRGRAFRPCPDSSSRPPASVPASTIRASPTKCAGAYEQLCCRFGRAARGPVVVRDRGHGRIVDGRPLHLGARCRRLGCVRRRRPARGRVRHRPCATPTATSVRWRCSSSARATPGSVASCSASIPSPAVATRSSSKSCRRAPTRSWAARRSPTTTCCPVAAGSLGSTHAGHIPPLDRGRRRALARWPGGPSGSSGPHRTSNGSSTPMAVSGSCRAGPSPRSPREDGRGSVLLGPGPLAETFPAPLRPLEEDLWIPPLRDGIIRALRTTGAVSNRSLERSPVVTTVGGWVAVDLELIGAVESRTTLRRRINPAAMVRRLATAWRVGRLRIALPRLADETVATVDRDLAMIPRLDELADGDLVDLLDRTRRELATIHAYEVLTGMLLGSEDGLSGAAMAVRALHDGRAAGWSDDEIVAGFPGRARRDRPTSRRLRPPCPPAASTPSGPVATIDHLDQREALRVRVRWLQELLARTVDELGRRLVGTDDTSRRRDGGCVCASTSWPPSATVDLRRATSPNAEPGLRGHPCRSRSGSRPRGDLRPASVSSHRRRASGAAGMPASGGRVVGVAYHRLPAGTPPDGTILVTRHLEPQLAPVLGGLTGLVSETGSALSHLAILAREAGLRDRRRCSRCARPIPARHPTDDRRPHRRDRGARRRPGSAVHDPMVTNRLSSRGADRVPDSVVTP